MKSRYGIKHVTEHRSEYDRRYYKANRRRILRQHAKRYLTRTMLQSMGGENEQGGEAARPLAV